MIDTVDPRTIRYAGLAGLAGGALLIALPLPQSGSPALFGSGGTADLSVVLLAPVVLVLVLVGLAGLHVREQEAYGSMGTDGAYVVMAGLGLVVVMLVLAGWLGIGGLQGIQRWVLLLGMAGLLVALAGMAALAVALWQSTDLSRLAVALLGAQLPVTVVAIAIEQALGGGLWFAYANTVPVGTAWILLGYELWEETEEPAEPPPAPASAFRSDRSRGP